MKLRDTLSEIALVSPTMRFYRMDDLSHPSWAIVHSGLWDDLRNMDTRVSFYKNGSFQIPDEAVWTWRIKVDHTASVLDCKLTASHAYIFAFETLNPGEDGNPHPRRAFRLKRVFWDRFINRAFDILELKRFPEPLFLQGFKRRTVQRQAPLRCVPKMGQNVPILYMPEQQQAFVSDPIYPVDNPIWCQIRLFSVTYWIENQYVSA
jgi:hypothetical protein